MSTDPDSAASSSLRLPLWFGRKVGRYEIIEVLGEGGMGVVYLAHDTMLRRRVALKLLRLVSHGQAEQEGTQRLLHEAQSAAALSHPNIIGIYDVGQHDGHVFVAMEYFEGHSLRRWLGMRRRSVDEILDVHIQVADALACAHEAGILHRDIKPDNVMVSERGYAKVLDFGLAQHESSSGDTSAVGDSLVDSVPADLPPADTLQDSVDDLHRVVGTRRYLAPELLAKGAATVRSEVFGFSATLYEALFDRPCLPGTDAHRPDAIATVSPNFEGRSLPRALRRLLARGLSPSPASRPARMRAVASALRRIRNRHRRRGFAVLRGALVAGGIALGYVQTTGDDEQDCKLDADQVYEIWSAEQREQLRTTVLGSEMSFGIEAWRNIEPRLDAFAMQWSQSRFEQCVALREHPDPARTDVLNRRQACLDHELQQLRGTLESVMQRDGLGVARSIQTVDALASPLDCLDPDYLDLLPPAPRHEDLTSHAAALRAELVRLSAARAGGRLSSTHERLVQLREQVSTWDEPAIEAEVELELGRTLAGLREHQQAELTLRRAVSLAERASYPHLRVRVSMELADVLGMGRKQFAEALEVSRAAKAAASAFMTPELEAQLLYGRAKIATAAERYDQAEELLERLLDRPAPTVQRDDVLHLLGVVLIKEDLGRSLETLELALASRQQRYGRDHPKVADTLTEIGRVSAYLRDLDRAEEVLQRARSIVERVYGADSLSMAEIEERLGSVDLRAGKDEQAAEHLAHALEIVSSDDDAATFDRASLYSALGVTASRAGRYHEAESLQRRAIDAVVRTAGTQHPRLTLPYVNLASNAERRGDFEGALLWYQRALQMCDIEGYRLVLEAEIGHMHLRLHNLERAQRRFAHVAAIASAEAPVGLSARCGLAEVLLASDRVDAAVEQLEALTPQPHEEHHGDPETVAQCRFALARAVDARGREPTRAKALADAAVADLALVGSATRVDRQRIEQWLRTPRRLRH